MAMEMMILAPGSDEVALQAWGMDFCKKMVCFFILKFESCVNEQYVAEYVPKA